VHSTAKELDMSSPTGTEYSKPEVAAATLTADQLEEPWFDEPPISQRPSSRPPPVVHVGEFLGDPEVDAWLR
jgi:hypothetical protein